MSVVLNVSISTIEREIPRMSSLIKHIGPKKGGHWEIIEIIRSLLILLRSYSVITMATPLFSCFHSQKVYKVVILKK